MLTVAVSLVPNAAAGQGAIPAPQPVSTGAFTRRSGPSVLEACDGISGAALVAVAVASLLSFRLCIILDSKMEPIAICH